MTGSRNVQDRTNTSSTIHPADWLTRRKLCGVAAWTAATAMLPRGSAADDADGAVMETLSTYMSEAGRWPSSNRPRITSLIRLQL